MLIGLEECLLRQILCIGKILRPMICKPIDGCLIFVHQLVKTVGIIVEGLLYKVLVLVVHGFFNSIDAQWERKLAF